MVKLKFEIEVIVDEKNVDFPEVEVSDTLGEILYQLSGNGKKIKDIDSIKKLV